MGIRYPGEHGHIIWSAGTWCHDDWPCCYIYTTDVTVITPCHPSHVTTQCNTGCDVSTAWRDTGCDTSDTGDTGVGGSSVPPHLHCRTDTAHTSQPRSHQSPTHPGPLLSSVTIITHHITPIIIITITLLVTGDDY